MSIWFAIAALAGADDPADVLMARARDMTTVSARCAEQPRADEVTVCARRRADAYRLPLVAGSAGTRADPTAGQRVAAIAERSQCDRLTPFLVGCGSVGAGVHVGSDGSARTFTARERTPDIAR